MSTDASVGLTADKKTKKKGTVARDPELVAMTKIVAIVDGLTGDARENVIEFLDRKYVSRRHPGVN